jgi:hypothetical protein
MVRVLEVPFSKPLAGCHVPFTDECLPSGHYHKGPIGALLQRLCLTTGRLFSECSSISTEELGFLITFLTKALLPRLLSLAGRPALGRVWVGRPLCFWGPSILQTFLGTLPQICASTQSCLRALQTIPSTSWLGYCSDMHCQLWDLI